MFNINRNFISKKHKNADYKMCKILLIATIEVINKQRYCNSGTVMLRLLATWQAKWGSSRSRRFANHQCVEHEGGWHRESSKRLKLMIVWDEFSSKNFNNTVDCRCGKAVLVLVERNSDAISWRYFTRCYDSATAQRHQLHNKKFWWKSSQICRLQI